MPHRQIPKPPETSPHPVVVVAIGGNAIIRPGEKGTVTEQFRNTRAILEPLIAMIEAGYRLVLTHGNGPQVGHKLLQVEAALEKVPETPLGVIVAGSEGDMGYMIEQSLMNLLRKRGLRYPVTTVLTQVIVDPEDPRSLQPTKPIGSFYREAEARQMAEAHGWQMIEDAGRGFRRVVPSPVPLEIVEKEVIRLLVENGVIVIAGGGGGIPVFVMEDGSLEGVDAVIDKDLTSSVLASDIQAENLLFLMDEDSVAINFGKPNEKRLGETRRHVMERYLRQGHFPPGSMGPKIEAALKFLHRGGKRAILTNGAHFVEALKGEAGTSIVA